MREIDVGAVRALRDAIFFGDNARGFFAEQERDRAGRTTRSPRRAILSS